MGKTPMEMLKAYVESQESSSTTEITGAMKEMFWDVLQQVMESELDTDLGYEKSQLGAVDVRIPRDRNGEYEPQIIGKYSRKADGME